MSFPVTGRWGHAVSGPAVVRSRPRATANADGHRALGVGRPHEGANYNGTFLSSWRPGLRSADADWLYDRDESVARTRDRTRNSPIGASAVNRRINSAVGMVWRLSSRPDARALGISFEAATELGKSIETAWKAYAYGTQFQVDAERQLTFGQLLRASAAHIFQDGEMLGLVEWASDETTPYQTRLRLVDPDRLSNPNGRPDTATLRGGIERNAAGVRTRYWIREAHPYDLMAGVESMTWRDWPVYSTTLGRPQVLHAYDKLRAGQSRGVSLFVSVLKSFKGFDKYTDATIEAAALDALFLGFVKSNAGLSAISESFTSEDLGEFCGEREDHYKENPIHVDGVQLPVLGLDDEVDLKTSSRDTTGFDGFVRSILRLIAAALGLTYEELSMDFSQTNYSSARAALLIAWQETTALRGLIEYQIARPFFVAWLEEAIVDKGTIKLPAGAPAFYDAVDAYAEGKWIGPGRGYIDPVKEIDAAAARIEAGISNLQIECAELSGEDWEDIQDQRLREELREKNQREALGLPPKAPAPGAAAARVAETARSPDHNAALDQRAAA